MPAVPFAIETPRYIDIPRPSTTLRMRKVGFDIDTGRRFDTDANLVIASH
jgi:hypothetical protein